MQDKATEEEVLKKTGCVTQKTESRQQNTQQLGC